ncbi:hypothetical protein ACFV0T_26540 [Streptomyces sp. NPDC059582]|uniref:hypothetical protein n=1 Tax=Streptomyces sp. NPDC059582 TaxID=3346875 RepID=UPI003686C277
MSAAEPVDPMPPAVNISHGAVVIDITKRAGRAAKAIVDGNSRGRRTGMNHAHAADRNRHHHPEHTKRSPAQQFADDIEAGFNAIDETLTDDVTARVFVRSLDVFAHTLKGAAATGVIGEEELAKLLELLEGMKAAPHLL